MNSALNVFNYNAGRKKALLCKKKLKNFLFRKTNKFKFVSIDEFDFVDIENYDVIFAVGGDGTVNKIAKHISNTNKILAIIPTGTANLLSANLGLSTNINKTLKIIDKEIVKKTDLIKINDIPCILRLGIGYDSDIICKTPQSLKNKFGYFAYFIAGIIFATRLKQKKYEIKYDDKTIVVNATGIIVANASNMYHNLVSVADNSSINDGLMDLFILKAVNPITYFYEFLKVLFGIRKTNPRAMYLKAKNIHIKNRWCACHIDGEKSKLKDNININIYPGAVKIFSEEQK